MKFRISMFAALVAMCLAPAAFGQQYYNPQPVPPVVAPQQGWNTGAYQTPPTQNAAFANNQVAAAPAAAPGAAIACDGGYRGGCDSYGGGCGGSACGGCGGGACGGYAGGGGGACGGFAGGGGGGCSGGACGGGGCGSGGCGGLFGGGCGGGLGGGCGLGGGGGLGGCLYDPCCPTKYFSIYGGLANFDAIGLDVGIAGANQPIINGTGFFEMNDGWAVGGAVGRSFGKRFRGELDFTYRNASVSNVGLAVGGAPLGTIPIGGKLNMYSFIPNIILDLNPNGRINGYIGVGAGVAFTDLSLSEPTIPVTVGLEASSFAYQGIAGVSAAVGQRAELFLEYRYFATDELSVSASAAPIGAAAASVDITSNNYFAGIRIKKW